VIHDHGAHGGPPGCYSISGVKFTTARRVAEQTLRTIFGRQLRQPSHATARPPPLLDLAEQTLLSTATAFDGAPDEVEARMRRIIREEAVLHAEDLLLRRLDSATILTDRSRATKVLRGRLASGLPEAGLLRSGTFAPREA
jgi:glycerol-3-phosphate dehydrogenase